jgi:hypothetical protein
MRRELDQAITLAGRIRRLCAGRPLRRPTWLAIGLAFALGLSSGAARADTCSSITLERNDSIPLGTCIRSGSSCSSDSQCSTDATDYCMKAVCSNNPSQFCTSDAQCGGGSCTEDITFRFDKAYTCGQFANDDWWIEADSSDRVVISSIEPRHTSQCESASSGCMNGFMVDPQPNHVAYSSRYGTYFNPLDTSTPRLPLTLSGINTYRSIVKSIDGGRNKNEGGPTQFVATLFAGVLTVVPNGNTPPANALRPAYSGPKKMPSLYTTADIDVAKVPRLRTTDLNGSRPDKREPKRFFGQMHFGFDHRNDLNHGMLQPYQACRGYPNCDQSSHYHAARAGIDGRNYLRLLLDDFDFVGNETDRKALYGAVQAGIDRAWAAKNWSGSRRIKDFLVPQLFAAKLLGDPGLIGQNFNAYSEKDTFYDSPRYGPGHPGDYLFGFTVSESVYWTRSNGKASDKWAGDPYGYAEGTLEPFGGSYQWCCSMMPWKGNALLVHLMQMEDLTDIRGFLHVMDRYHDGWKGTPSMSGGHFALNDPVKYESGPGAGNSSSCAQNHNCKPAATDSTGRNRSVHGKGGGGWGEPFGDAMWSSFRRCADETYAGVPSTAYPCVGMIEDDSLPRPYLR